MKKYLTTIFLLSSLIAVSQDISIESLRQSLVAAREDTTKIQLLRQLAIRYLDTRPDSSIILYSQGLELARRKKLTKLEVILLGRMSRALAQFPEKKDSSLLCMQQAIVMARKNNFYEEEAWCYNYLSLLYFFNWKQPGSAFSIAYAGIEFTKKHKLTVDQLNLTSTLIGYYIESGKVDDALQVYFDGFSILRKNKLHIESELEYYQAARYILRSVRSVDTSRLLMEKVRIWASKNKEPEVEGYFLLSEGDIFMGAFNYPEALKSFLAAIKIFETAHAERQLVFPLNQIGQIYFNLAEYRHSLSYHSRALALQEILKDSLRMLTYRNMGFNYAKLKMNDSAVYFARKCYAEAEHIDKGSQFAWLLDDVAEIYAEVEEDSIAMQYFRRSLRYFEPDGPNYANVNRAEIFAGIAKLFDKAGQNDSAFFYASMALPVAKMELSKDPGNVNLTCYMYNASNIIAAYYKSKHILDSAFVYREIEIAAKDSLSGQDKLKELRTIEFNETLRQQQVKEDSIRSRNRVNTYFFVGGIAVVLLIASLLYRNNRIKQKANLVLQQQKQKVEKTLEQLTSTQQQLIQSEKMASLGELTAGIAHEIQNPLNFVNNFSEVNDELLKELKTEAEKGNFEEVKAIANDIAFNSEKINYHGKRADSIVKGMLQHSRTSSGQKEPTDINALADEYLRLAYHGLRAKDKTFNAITKTEFDNSIGKINVVPQEIGRVILNLINNAFYAVSEKQKQNLNEYEPSVTVSTLKSNGKVEIKVKDNGNGIAQKNLEKIFQPFFTTKPTGQGTGLGLSLAYDIVTKGHGGELKVETKEGEGSEFVIQLHG